MTPYADAAALTAWLPAGTTVSDAVRLLTRASELIDDAVRVPYAVDSSGVVSDATTATVLSDACCAVVEHWLEVGEENDIDGLDSTQVSVTGYSGKRAPRFGPRALRILRTNGLMSSSGLDTTAIRFFGSETGS
jgi:hypothetical protein